MTKMMARMIRSFSGDVRMSSNHLRAVLAVLLHIVRIRLRILGSSRAHTFFRPPFVYILEMYLLTSRSLSFLSSGMILGISYESSSPLASSPTMSSVGNFVLLTLTRSVFMVFGRFFSTSSAVFSSESTPNASFILAKNIYLLLHIFFISKLFHLNVDDSTCRCRLVLARTAAGLLRGRQFNDLAVRRGEVAWRGALEVGGHVGQTLGLIVADTARSKHGVRGLCLEV
ncbi:hypothetical protein ATCV1_z244R [Acanthocystis turfacea chlorella virus 1]|uniref:Uncharacterized protein z244R n=1 Tax=Chlorovirus heliozoae TaxID=322019 RepID=A7K8K4_9PHYC|nr:hypothetical protein ATCV1_z244R [Acanthocystis turfacea chlorella virus 1]ABT16378.1 hypothetical protein ATCV1_z244R [Acanthocystis turfacea chlorella virus 1]